MTNLCLASHLQVVGSLESMFGPMAVLEDLLNLIGKGLM